MSSFSRPSFINENDRLIQSPGQQQIYMGHLCISESSGQRVYKHLKCAFPRTALQEIDPKEISGKCRRTYVKDINQSGVYNGK